MSMGEVKGAKLLTEKEKAMFEQYMNNQFQPRPTKLAVVISDHLHKAYAHIESARKVHLRKIHAACMDAFAQNMRDAGINLPGNLDFGAALKNLGR